MNSNVAWVLVFQGTQFHLQIILDSDYLPDYLTYILHVSVSLKNYTKIQAKVVVVKG